MKSLTTPITLLALGILVLAGVLLFKPLHTAIGGAFTGTSAYLQTATTTAVGPDTVKTLFAAKTDGSCKSRVVTTQGTSAIMLSFGDTTGFGSTTIGGTAGHLQAASTTEVYDGELYGCGRVTAFAWASSTLTTSEF